MNIFEAETKYSDFTGSVAADRGDDKSFIQHLKNIGQANENEQLAGYRIVFNDNSGREMGKPGLVAYLYEADEHTTNPNAIRAIDINMPTAMLFSFFKSFDLVMTIKGMDLDDVLVDGPN